MATNRKLRDRAGNLTPLNDDGTVSYTPRTTVPPPAPVANTHGPVAGGYGFGIGTVFYYLFKLLMLAVCLALGLLLGALLSHFSDILFGQTNYASLLGILKDLLVSFFPLISLVASVLAGGYYITMQVSISEWKMAFIGPLVTLVVFLGVGLLLFLLNLALKRWWSALLFLFAAVAVGGALRDD